MLSPCWAHHTHIPAFIRATRQVKLSISSDIQHQLKSSRNRITKPQGSFPFLPLLSHPEVSTPAAISNPGCLQTTLVLMNYYYCTCKQHVILWELYHSNVTMCKGQRSWKRHPKINSGKQKTLIPQHTHKIPSPIPLLSCSKGEISPPKSPECFSSLFFTLVAYLAPKVSTHIGCLLKSRSHLHLFLSQDTYLNT